MEVNRQSTNSSKQGSSRPSPGLTLESLNFKNIPKTLKQNQKSQYSNKNRKKEQNNNLMKYTKVVNDEEIQKNLANSELFFEKNILNQPKKKEYQRQGPIAMGKKTDIYYPKNYKNSNAEVLSKILDSNCEFSANAPSNLKMCENELENIKRNEYKNNINNNNDEEENIDPQNQLLNSQSQEMQENNNINNNNNLDNNNMNNDINNQQQDMEKQNTEEEENNNEQQDKKLTINLSYNGDNLSDTYLDAINQVLSLLDPVFEGLSTTDKIEKLLSLTVDERKNTRLGALICLYIMLKKYSSEIDEEHKGMIISKVIELLQSYNKQEEIFLVACLEICSLYGPIDLLLENIGLICMFITDFNFPYLQNATFNCLMCMEYEGIRTLVELASKDYQDYQSYILNSLIQTPHIQKIIIIRALLNELYSNEAQRRNTALAALNRMHDLICDPDTLEKIESFFYDPKMKKEFIASSLRTCGEEGENILLQQLKTNKDFNVRTAIANALSYRLPKVQKYLEIKLDKNDTYSISNNLPGSFCTYYGSISPFIENKNYTIEQLLETDDFNDMIDTEFHNHSNNNTTDTPHEDYLEVNTRDFLAALQRMLIMNYEHTNPRLVHNGHPNTIDNINFKLNKSELVEKYMQFLDLSNVNNKYENPNNNFNEPNIENANNTQTDLELDESGRYFISEDVIKALSKCLKDYSGKVREAAATSLGIIGMPEALLAIDSLVENIKDEEVDVKSKIIWAIGRVAEGTDNSIIPFIIDCVKSNMWKVKKASLYTLAQLGDRCAKNALPYLLKLLKESPINKQSIAECIVKLGLEGESVLLKMMSQEPDSNYKLKTAVISALALADINSTNIDFIIECIFKQGKNSSAFVRKAAIISIKTLAEKAEEKLTYLKRKNVIPFYYDKLKDKDLSIQSFAVNCIKSLGAQGELIFIEGFVKDPNPIVRSNCGIGLGELGVHTLRTLLVGLHDENQGVRSTVEKIILSQMNINDVINYFSSDNYGNQLSSLKISIKDILDKKYPLSMYTLEYFNQLLAEIDKCK